VKIMTKKAITTTAPRKPVGLASLVVSTTIRPIVEDLAALAPRLPDAPTDVARFAGLAAVQPASTAIVARAGFYQDELERFVKLLSKDTALVEARIDTFNGLNILRQGAYLALALLDPQNDDDAWAKDLIGTTLVAAAKRQGDPTRAAVLRTAFGVTEKPKKKPAPIGEMPAWLRETSRRMGLIRPPAPETFSDDLADAGFYRLEEAPSLEAFFAAAPDLTSLAEEGMDCLLLADAWPHEVDGPDERRESAAKSALTLAYAAITRVGLWPARTERDLHAKAVCRAILRNRVTDPARLRAVAAMAFDIGNGIAAQSGRFTVEPQHETERFPGQG
jgi:hypothetical protein